MPSRKAQRFNADCRNTALTLLVAKHREEFRGFYIKAKELYPAQDSSFWSNKARTALKRLHDIEYSELYREQKEKQKEED